MITAHLVEKICVVINKQDIATKQLLPEPVEWPFTDAVLAAINPVFQQLVSTGFLECCTQNPNEALNHVIRSLTLKEKVCFPIRNVPCYWS